jgi:hypothetical protein
MHSKKLKLVSVYSAVPLPIHKSNTKMSSSHLHRAMIHRMMDHTHSSPTPPNAPKKSRNSCSSPSREELDTVRITGIHAFDAIMMEPKPFMPPNWNKKTV